VFVAYCPERVLPGRILIEVIENDRIVGGITPACAREAVAFYNSFIEGDAYATSAVSAEIVKLAENSYRDVNIAFANELASLAAGFGADPFEIVNLANCHPRVDILRSGPGVGGHCISVDPWFLVAADPQSTSLIRTAREVNDRRPYQIVDQIQTLVQTHKISKVGCLGLAYKADVDDLRESPSLDIVLELRRRGIADIMACDPYVTETEIEGLPLFELDVLVEECDLLVMLTDHSQFLQLPTATLSQKILVDTRGKWKDATERTEATEDQQLVLAAVSQRAA
ncbi:MAG: nucleotide sugar dehydrogenase, partial [Planctomycetota bacterium]